MLVTINILQCVIKKCILDRRYTNKIRIFYIIVCRLVENYKIKNFGFGLRTTQMRFL